MICHMCVCAGGLQGDTVLANRLFAALSVEPAGSRTALQEALGGLAAAMTAGMKENTAAAGAPAANGDSVAAGPGDESKQQEIEQLLEKNITSDQVQQCLCPLSSSIFMQFCHTCC